MPLRTCLGPRVHSACAHLALVSPRRFDELSSLPLDVISVGDPVGIVVPQPTGPSLRVIGLFVHSEEAHYILAVPVKSYPDLDVTACRENEGESAPF